MKALGIDAGASSTKFALLDASGALLETGRVGPLSGHLFDERSRLEARQVMQQLRAQLAAHQVTVALAGVTGLTRDSAVATWVRDALREELGLEHCRVMSDMDLAYLAHFAPGAGMVVYAGTGSIAYHIAKSGRAHRAGGRGYLIDDAGGGFWIGQRALRVVARDMDAGVRRDDPLTQALIGRLGSEDWDAMRAFVYGGGRSAVASLAPLVGQAASQGSQAARGILLEAGQELAALAQRLQAQVGVLPLILSGGAFRISALIAQTVRQSGLAARDSELDVARAAAQMALRGDNHGD